jgi:two-component system OmpR family sensor kinase/two-component system sensor histidine kinase BaeS
MFVLSILGIASVISLAGGYGLTGLFAGFRRGPFSPFVWVAFFFVIVIWQLLFSTMRRRFGSPLGDVVAAADRAGSGDLSVRVREAGPPFLRTIARAFNSMLGRLKTQDDQRRQLMADIAHELRTPLSVIQGRLEGIVDGVYPSNDEQIKQLLEDTRVLSRLVEDLRTLANAESGAFVLQREPTDLAVLIADVLGSFRAQADTRHVTLHRTIDEGVPQVEIDPVRIREVLTNVLANALQHTPAGGSVSVALHAVESGIRIQVIDTGEGIDAADLPKIFDRFSKGTQSRGSGLGLAIARRLVIAHGGTIEAASERGRGATMTIALPMRGAGPTS